MITQTSNIYTMKKQILFTLSTLILLTFGCKKDEVQDQLDIDLEAALSIASSGQGMDHYILPYSGDYDNIPQDPRNPLSKEKINLGKLLYHETGLALSPMQEVGKGTYSCASCHFASAGFQAGRIQGIGEGGSGFGVNGEGRERDQAYDVLELDVQPVRSPSALNLAYQEAVLWNGQFGATGINQGTDYAWVPGTPIETNELGYQGLEIQAIAGLTVHRMTIDKNFLDQNGYTEMFDRAFSAYPEDRRYTKETAGLAIAAYERTMLANQAPFQEWLKGNNRAMSEDEKRGAILFFGEAGCATCHNGPTLSKMEFHALGMKNLIDCPEPTFQTPVDHVAYLGRGGFTGEPEDMYKFKVPQLYNLIDSPFFGHGSSLRSVREVIEYKNDAVAENPDVPTSQLSEHFVPLGLTSVEIDQITAFIENSLRDPNLDRYVPNSLPSGNCFPFADPLSKEQLGCD